MRESSSMRKKSTVREKALKRGQAVMRGRALRRDFALRNALDDNKAQTASSDVALPTYGNDIGTSLVADSPVGIVGLEISLTGSLHSVPCAIALALQMGMVEHHLDFLGYWLGTTLDPRPATRDEPRLVPLLSLVAGANTDEEAVLTLALEPEAWGRLAPIETMATDVGWELRWARCAARIVFDAFALTPAERDCIVPGSVVLAPTSFHRPWRTHLQLERADLSRRGVFDPVASHWRISGASGDSIELAPRYRDSRVSAVPAVLSARTRVSARLFTADIPSALEVDMQRAAGTCELVLHDSERYHGDLVPIANGFGFRVSERWI